MEEQAASVAARTFAAAEAGAGAKAYAEAGAWARHENTWAGSAFQDETAFLSAGMSTASTPIWLNNAVSSDSLAFNMKLPSFFLLTAAWP